MWNFRQSEQTACDEMVASAPLALVPLSHRAVRGKEAETLGSPLMRSRPMVRARLKALNRGQQKHHWKPTPLVDL